MEYEGKVDQNNTLPIQEYLDEIIPYLKDVKNNLKHLIHKEFN